MERLDVSRGVDHASLMWDRADEEFREAYKLSLVLGRFVARLRYMLLLLRSCLLFPSSAARKFIIDILVYNRSI